jgi:hypothetical protein
MWLAIAQSSRAILLSAAAVAAAMEICERFQYYCTGMYHSMLRDLEAASEKVCAWRGSEKLRIWREKGREEERNVLRGHRRAGSPFDGRSGGER